MSGTGAESEEKTTDKTEAESATGEKQSDNGESTSEKTKSVSDNSTESSSEQTPEAEPDASKSSEQTAEAEQDASKSSEGASEQKEESGTESSLANSESKSAENVAATSSDGVEDKAADKKDPSLTLTQHHVSHLLSDVLKDEGVEEAPVAKGFRFPMIFDLLLGAGLLVAVGGFTVGLLHLYIVHSASQFISEQRYEKAIKLLRGAPLPQVFSRTGTDTEELLSKARYLDAMDKIESNNNVDFALKELAEIHPGSKYFALAQEAINENTEPAEVLLQGGAETTEAPAPEREQTLLEQTLKQEQEKESGKQ
jgi:hypothetical protein